MCCPRISLKSNLYSLLILFSLVFSSSCTQLTQKITKEEINLSPQPDKQFTVRATFADGNKIRNSSILGAIVKHVRHLPGMKKYDDDSTLASGTRLSQGISVSPTKNGFSVSFAKQENYARYGNAFKTEIKAEFKMSELVDGAVKSITVSYPKQLILLTGRNSSLKPISQLLPNEDAIKILSAIYSNLDFKIQATNIINGEVETEYNKKAIFTNFEKILGVSLKSNHGPRDSSRTYNLLSEGKKIPLYIQVVSDGGAPIVQYSFNLEYELNSSGGSTYNIAEEKELIKKVVKIIEN